MVGRRDLPQVINVSRLRHQSALITLRKVRKEGHVYVEIRQDGKRYIFFCVLCLAPCYSDTILFDHLRGNSHRKRCKTAQVTLLMDNPWPFNDGIFFFHDSAVNNGSSSNVNVGGSSSDLVIPGVLKNEELSSLDLKLVGFGEIGARMCESDHEEIVRIWCAWLGKRSSDNDDNWPMLPTHDFGVVTLTYDYNLGRILGDSSTSLDVVNVGGGNKRKRKSVSDPEDISQSLREQGGCSSVQDYQPSVVASADHQLPHSKSTKRRIRREMREQQRIAAERMCDICHIKLLPGKDVACLMNMKTGRLACSSRNFTGAFHLFHTSCLLHWILLCEHEIWTNRLTIQEAPRQPKKKSRTKRSAKRGAKKMDDDRRFTPQKISSIFCPECQGTGINVEEDQLESLERPLFLLSEMFNFKIKSKDAQKAWMKGPEILPNCSLGLHFLRHAEETAQEKVVSLKLLHFYRAEV